MSIGIGDNLSESFGYAKDKLVGSIGNWILLIILTIIPIVNFIAIGTYLKIFRGEDPKVENIGKSFVDGILAFIILFIYLLIPIFIFSMVMWTAVSGLTTDSTATLIGAGIGGIIWLIIFILFGLILTPALINFARNGFGAAFKFGEIFGMISKAGWLNYILAIIVLGIIFGLLGLLEMIPYVGWLIMIIIFPFLTIWASKFWTNLFE
ncbi:MAG TPA: DUF4013 domain-containing protein [Methanocorpusculum sp.]|nr:DUF4013 domain-containing protein [Methanocorpusculum sp.]HJJ50194.1 DUF4013 domain-containing protein [Methanocorpusculum sp.]